jgi:diguanylate cyclase
MKYSQGTAESAELLRLTLQKMVSQPAALTPPNYAVWYEHLAGINPPLSEAMNKLLDSDAKLDDDTIEKFYAQHVSECSSDIQQVLRGGIKQLLNKLSVSTAEATRDALQFGHRLQTHGNALKDGLDSSELGTLINNLAGDTGKMHGSMQTLEAQLQTSKQEVEKLNQEVESARAQALTDPLTSLLNRRGFESKALPIFTDPASKRNGFCMLMLDIDHFKKVNDTYGHLFGDKVICAIANTLKSKVKGQDAIARIGGEEFAVLLPETNIKGALAVAEQIRQAVENGKIRHHDSEEPIGGISISIGVASHREGCNLEALLDQADRALYTSKQSGRNRTSVFGSH